MPERAKGPSLGARLGDALRRAAEAAAERPEASRETTRGALARGSRRDFLLFGLGMGAGGVAVLRDRAAIVGQVLMAVGDAGIYLAEPPRCIPWPEVAGLVVFRAWQGGDDADSGEWHSQVAVVASGEDVQPGAGASSPDQCGATVDLHEEKVRLGKLSDAVHTYAPGLPVWDAGKIKSKNVRVEGR